METLCVSLKIAQTIRYRMRYPSRGKDGFERFFPRHRHRLLTWFPKGSLMPIKIQRRRRGDKPLKPYPDFPLTANGNGQW